MQRSVETVYSLSENACSICSNVYRLLEIIHKAPLMRTNIDIDDALMTKAMTLSGYKTKRETVEAALELLVRLKSQEAIRAARGKLRWEGDLDEMRADR